MECGDWRRTGQMRSQKSFKPAELIGNAIRLKRLYGAIEVQRGSNFRMPLLTEVKQEA
jgi:hypothetical protein